MSLTSQIMAQRWKGRKFPSRSMLHLSRKALLKVFFRSLSLLRLQALLFNLSFAQMGERLREGRGETGIQVKGQLEQG